MRLTSSRGNLKVPATYVPELANAKGKLSIPSKATSQLLPWWLALFGFKGRILRKQNGATITAQILAWISTPLPCSRRYIGYTTIFSICLGSPEPPFSVRTFNLVPEDADIMTACGQGDLSWVRTLFESGQANVHDITPNNFSTLYVGLGASIELIWSKL